MHTETIGTAQTYTTIQGWEDGRDGVLTEIEKGECLAEAFDENVFINGSTTAADKYMWLTSVAGAEHDGRAHDVSAAGNARIEGSVNNGKIINNDEFFHIDWLEIDSNITSNLHGITNYSLGASTIHMHHMIVHNDGKHGSSGSYGMAVGDTDVEAYIYRNIVYGWGASGIYNALNAANSETFNNTTFNNNIGANASMGGVECESANVTVRNNVGFDNGNEDFRDDAGTFDYNCAGDISAAGANSINSKTDTINLTNPTATWNLCDLTIKNTDADIYQAGINANDAGWGGAEPDNAVPISDRNTFLAGGSLWSMGADDIEAAGGGVVIFRRRRSD